MKRYAVLAAIIMLLGAAAPAAAQEALRQEDVIEGREETDPFDEQPVETVVAEPLGSKAMRGDLKSQGFRNGRLPRASLDEVESGTAERCYLEHDAAVAWELLVLAAEHDGVTGFAAGWCYRDLEQQERTYNRNCPWVTPPAPPVVEGEEPLPPPPPYRECKLPTALPGTSNHGWGRAVDVVDTTTRKAHILSCRDPQFLWLVENGERFGWVLPAWARCGSRSQEPWHFEWAGLSIPITELIVIERAARGAEVPH